MGQLVAQEFERMRREIGDQDAPARPEHARGIDDGGLRIVEIMQHLMEQHRIEARHPARRPSNGRRKTSARRTWQ